MRTAPRLLACGLTLAALVVALGCGSKFALPPETPGGLVPPDKAYTFRGAIENLPDLTDVLITKSSGIQLLLLRGAVPDRRTECSGELPGGRAEMYPIFGRTGTPPLSLTFNGLWRPQLAAENGGTLFIFDAGDTCAGSGNPERMPRVVLYHIGVPEPIRSFTDTAWAEVRGLAVSRDRTVYVCGTFRVLDLDDYGIPNTQRFHDAIWRYKEADGYAHRDFGWTVLEGTGSGFIESPGRIAWGPSWDPYLWVVDGGKQAIQKLAIEADSLSHGVYQIDGTLSGERFQELADVAVDDSSYLHIVDRGTARVLRYHDEGPSPTYIQRVNLVEGKGEITLQAPAATAVLDTICYVVDPAKSAAIRYERRRPCPTCF